MNTQKRKNIGEIIILGNYPNTSKSKAGEREKWLIKKDKENIQIDQQNRELQQQNTNLKEKIKYVIHIIENTDFIERTPEAQSFFDKVVKELQQKLKEGKK